MRLRKRSILVMAGVATVLLVITALYVAATLPDVSDLKGSNPGMTALMRLRVEQAEKAGVPLEIRQQWVPFNEIPALLKKAVRITEDASFYSHEGVDYEELKESVKKNFKEGKLARGGSTISQQLAKNLYLTTEKSFARKGKELLITRRLERTLTKDRIFEIYLNVIEFGPGIFGVGAASRHYFGIDPYELSLEQTVRLVAVIPRPLTTAPNSDSEWLEWKTRWILDKLLRYKYITEEEHEETIKKGTDP
jgi:monofunctional biosynthetic peptidoglycan transglycosylase